MIEIRITPNSPEELAKVIALLNEMNGTLAETKKAKKKTAAEALVPSEPLPEITIEQIEAAPAIELAAELPEVTLEQVRARLAQLSQDGKAPQVKEILAGYGATKLTEVPADKYGELLAATEAL